jgi:hypothetical protein
MNLKNTIELETIYRAISPPNIGIRGSLLFLDMAHSDVKMKSLNSNDIKLNKNDFS